MSNVPYYPTLTDSNLIPLRGIIAQNDMHDRYLDRDECPYSDAVKDFLSGFLRQSVGESSPLPEIVAAIEEDYGSDKPQFLEKQVLGLLKDIELYNLTLRTKDNKEKMDFFKMKNVLIMKLVEIQERVYNLREYSEFQSIILQFLEEVCDKDQVNDLMKRLDHMASQQKTA
jgi:hypothetical protein